MAFTKMAFVVIVAAQVVAVALGSGCAPVLIGAVALSGTANKKNYTQYVMEMERINLEREKAGLAPRPILEYSQWCKSRSSGRGREPAASQGTGYDYAHAPQVQRSSASAPASSSASPQSTSSGSDPFAKYEKSLQQVDQASAK